MKKHHSRILLQAIFFVILMTALLGCAKNTDIPDDANTPEATMRVSASTATTEAHPEVAEVPVVEIPLAGPIAKPDAEISGMAWYGEVLVLLPQYPGRLGDNLFTLPKQELLSFLNGEISGPLTPAPLPLDAPGLSKLPGYEGLEAIAFQGDRFFVTVESRVGSQMMGYLAGGTIAPDLSEVRIVTKALSEIQSQAKLSNYSDETLLVGEEVLLTIYEANGEMVNPDPAAHRFGVDLTPLESIPFPNIEYRVTDATSLDGEGRFWVINYLYPGDIGKLRPDSDPLVERFGAGPSHASSEVVERLVELQFNEAGISLVDRPPIQLALMEDSVARNWEGIVRLPERGGFLLVTDKFPTTILGFVGVR